VVFDCFTNGHGIEAAVIKSWITDELLQVIEQDDTSVENISFKKNYRESI
jgi:hypothetical protein